MPEQYQPRKLPRNREYPGFQFYSTIQKQDSSSEECFCYAVLCVIDWLKQRLRETEVIPKQISRLPERQRSHVICSDDLESFTINSGFSAYVVSLPNHGIWTLRLKEPDSDTADRKAVPGRFFATNVGIHILNDQQIELGIRIDVTDPEGTPEIDFAFRPRLLRYLFQTPEITLAQAVALPYQKAITVENDEQFKTLRSILDSSEETLPLIIVTQGIKLPEEKPVPFIRKMPFSSTLGAPPASLFPTAFPTTPVLEQYFPFDADEIAAHNFGYAITCRVSENIHSQLKSRLKKDYTPGDLLFVEPKRYGGNIRIISKDDKEVIQQVWQRAHCYSKDRKYSFGDVQFEFDARNIENREKIEQIRTSSDMESEEKLEQLNQKIDELQEENEKRVRKISELREQAQIEYDKGVQAERQNNLELIEDHDKLERDLQAANARIFQLEQENRTARAKLSAVDTLRNLAEQPKTNEDVINYFRNIFSDRIVFTEQGIKTGCKSDIKADGLWYYLFQMATTLFDIHHAGSADVENEFLHTTGTEIALSEGKQTNKGGKFRKQRKDVYEGKEITIAPHVKLDSQRTGAQNRRIYYCYDRELDKIIIGWIGVHLDTAGTMHMS